MAKSKASKQTVSDASDTLASTMSRLAVVLGVSPDALQGEGGYPSGAAHLFDHLIGLSLQLKRYIVTYGHRMVDRSGGLNDALVSVDEMMAFFGRGDSTPEDVRDNVEGV